MLCTGTGGDAICKLAARAVLRDCQPAAAPGGSRLRGRTFLSGSRLAPGAIPPSALLRACRTLTRMQPTSPPPPPGSSGRSSAAGLEARWRAQHARAFRTRDKWLDMLPPFNAPPGELRETRAVAALRKLQGLLCASGLPCDAPRLLSMLSQQPQFPGAFSLQMLLLPACGKLSEAAALLTWSYPRALPDFARRFCTTVLPLPHSLSSLFRHSAPCLHLPVSDLLPPGLGVVRCARRGSRRDRIREGAFPDPSCTPQILTGTERSIVAVPSDE